MARRKFILHRDTAAIGRPPAEISSPCMPFDVSLVMEGPLRGEAEVSQKATRLMILSEMAHIRPRHAGFDIGARGMLVRLAGSLRLRARELDDLAPFLGLIGNELAEIGRRTGKHGCA